MPFIFFGLAAALLLGGAAAVMQANKKKSPPPPELAESTETTEVVDAVEVETFPPPITAAMPSPEVVSSSRALSKYFTLDEFLISATARQEGIVNEPNETQLVALRALARTVLDPIREAFGELTITSGFRSELLNNAVGGASQSQHTRGEAVDVESRRLSSPDLMVRLWNLHREGLPLDQVILYHPSQGGHVHISHTRRRANRGQFLFKNERGEIVNWRAS